MEDKQKPSSSYNLRRSRRDAHSSERDRDDAGLPTEQNVISPDIPEQLTASSQSEASFDANADLDFSQGLSVSHLTATVMNEATTLVNTSSASITTADNMNLGLPFDMSALLVFLNNKFEESNAKLNETKIELESKVNANINTKLNETESKLKASLNETKTEINNCQLAIEYQISEIRKDQNDFRQEINEIRTIQANQNEEIAKLNLKLDNKIEQSHQEIKSFLTESILKHQNTIEAETQQRQTEILHTVTQKLDSFSHSVDTQIANIAQQTHSEIEAHSKNYTHTLQNEIIPKIELQTKIIESQQADINHINQAIDHCDSEIKSLKLQTKLGNFNNGAIQVICPGSSTNDRQLPKFNGRTSNPNEYLQRLKRYYEKSIERNQPTNTTEHLCDILENSFEGPASRWLQLIKTDIASWEQFSQEFLSKYWNRDIQRGIKAKIEAEKYRNNGTLTRTEYFTERVLLLQSITPTLSEEEIVTTLAERFDSLIQDSINVQHITTIRDFERLLQREDIREGPKRNKNPNSFNNQQNSRPSSPNHMNRHSNHNDRQYEFKAYQPRYNNQNQNKPYFQPHNNHSNHQNHQNNPNYRHNYRNHQNNKPYYREQPKPRYEPNQPQQGHRPYPTNEQSQVCAMIRENAPPMPRNPPEPDRRFPTSNNSTTPHSSSNQENLSAL